MKIRVTAQDIRGAGRDLMNSPLTRAIQRVLGKSWVVFMCARALEMAAPYRQVSLPSEVSKHCDRHYRTGQMDPFEFEIVVEGEHEEFTCNP